MSTKGQKLYCAGCRTSRYDCRKYRFVASSRMPVYFCKGCASARKDIEPAVNQKVGK